ncbi:hypothetical protein JKF63_05182 [Porcisia hertigi]|uniref:Uncharacterized protein n=1 Tax=Porcisia hertigi TaxID=2761500 RepID=A0A836I713_9TRYP|nr:hypothetical protein JKF63_05182 [Porcisia hertigi]
MNFAREPEIPLSTEEGSPTLIRRFAIPDSSSDDDDNAAPYPVGRYRLGSNGNIDLSAFLDYSSESDNPSVDRASAQKATLGNAESASSTGSSACVVADLSSSTASDVAAEKQRRQLRRPFVVSSTAIEQSLTSHETSLSLSSAVVDFRRLHRGEVPSAAGVRCHTPNEPPTYSPGASLINDIPSQSPSVSNEVSPAPSPKGLGDAKVTSDSSKRSPPQSCTLVAPVTQSSVRGLPPSALVETLRSPQPTDVASHLLTFLEKPQYPGRGLGASSASRASVQKARRSRPASAPSGVHTLQPQRQVEDVEPPSPSSGKSSKTRPQWSRQMRKDGMYVPRVRVTNPSALYDRGIRGLEKASAKREAMRAQLEEAALTGVTFHPSISRRVKSLNRGGNGAAADRDSSAQLRYRLQLLELPEELPDDAHRHTPRLSRTSERIVRACRERGGAELPPEERLYRDYFYRRQAIEGAQPVTSQPAVVRSKRDIEAHIAELYSFEQQRQFAIAAAREVCISASADAHRRLYVDPKALVERLTTKRFPSQRRIATAQLESVQFSFQPRTSAGAAELAHQARLRGIRRWVRYFCNADSLSVPVLSMLQGQAVPEAATLLALLQRHNPTKTDWSVEELANAFADEVEGQSFVADLWHRRPPVGEASARASELTFRPCLNPKSAIIVDKMETVQRCGPTPDRLFLNARARQLSQRQKELEEEQASLESKQREQLRRQRLQAAWRAKEAHRLEAYRSAKEEDRRKSAGMKAAVPRERSCSGNTPCTCRFLAPSTPPQSFGRGSIVEPPSSSPRQATATSTVAALELSSSIPSIPATSLSPLPQVARVGGNTIVSTTRTTESAEDSGSTNSSCSSPAFRQTVSSAQVAQRAPPLTRTMPQGVETLCEVDRSELDRAAKALRDLLESPVRRSGDVPQASSVASPQCSPQVATCFFSRDVNHPCCSQGKLHSCPTDVVLQCAQLRDPHTLLSGERERLDRAQKRQLRDLGRLLYSRHKFRIDDKNRS